MSDITRPGTEKLTIAACPCCGGEIHVWDCGYSSFNPGGADCKQCLRKWKLGYVDNRWDAGLLWNKKAASISRRLLAASLIKVEEKVSVSRDFENENLIDEAKKLIQELDRLIIGCNEQALTEQGE